MEAEAEGPFFKLTSPGVLSKENVLVLDVDAADGSTASGVQKETPEFGSVLLSAFSGSDNFATESVGTDAAANKLHVMAKRSIF